MAKKLLGLFTKKNCKRQIKKNLELNRSLKGKETSCMLNGKVMIIRLIVGLIKNILYKISQYFPKPYEPFGGDINVKVDLSNYVKKDDLKNATGIDKSDLASLKTEADKIGVDKLKTAPID